MFFNYPVLIRDERFITVKIISVHNQGIMRSK